MDINKYKCEDFLEDTSFLSYVKDENEEDVRFWEDWIQKHPEKSSDFNKAKEILNRLNLSYQDNLTISKEKELSRLLDRIHLEKSQTASMRAYWLGQFFRYAALLILVLGVGYAIKLMLFKEEKTGLESLTYKEIKTPKGKRLHIKLSDGTNIWVNSESTLRYPEVFSGDERKVYLEGEAYFDVTENKSNPFYVYASEVRVKVLGTAFNVRSYPEDDFIEATLERGKINIERLDQGNSDENIITMVPNQKVTLFKAGHKADLLHDTDVKTEKFEKLKGKEALIAKNIETDIYTSWKDEKLIFRSEPLEKLKLRLERWYNIPIVIKDQRLLEKKFTGTFENEPINAALKALSVASELEFEIANDTVFLMMDK